MATFGRGRARPVSMMPGLISRRPHDRKIGRLCPLMGWRAPAPPAGAGKVAETTRDPRFQAPALNSRPPRLPLPEDAVC